MWKSIKRIDDAEENVAKFVFTKDSAVVESVLYKYPTYEERTVICCSTQSGCPVGCRFCGAGDYFVRNLTTEEIVSQVDHSIQQTGVFASSIDKLQIMFMSMGEPLLNLKALIPALYSLNLKYPQAKLLISTSGPRVSEEAWEDFIEASIMIPNIGLQFSVHESTNAARNLLVPFKAKMTLEEMASLGADWFMMMDDGRKPFFNYCAHENNSSDQDVERILQTYNPSVFNATVSVICERNEGMPASNEKQRSLASDFANKLLAVGYDVRVFDPAGQDTIGGGCGQLWFVQQWMRDNPNKARPSVGNGLKVVHTPK
jgi:23S rRNA (adenine2503-C2)-methyltransferase